MTPSGNDFQFEFDPTSFIAALRKVDRARQDVEKGLAGAAERLSKGWEDLSKIIGTSGTKVETNLRRQVDALSRSAEAAGRSPVERLIVQQDQYIARINKVITAEDQKRKMIDSVTASYKKLIDAENARPHGGGESGETASVRALRGARDLFEGRTAYGMVQFGRSLQALEGTPLILGGIAAGILGIGFAAKESMSSLGEYATHLHDIELRTGLTTKEVTQFSFAAKVVGQDVTLVERMMRGLSQASDDTSKQGEQARRTMERLGITFVDANGAGKSTSQMLEDIAVKLSALPAGVERDAAAMALFKRIGVEAIPFITELTENLRIAREHGWGPNSADIAQMRTYQRQLTEIDMAWEDLKRQIKAPLAAVLSVSLKYVGDGWRLFSTLGAVGANAAFGTSPTATDKEMIETGGYGYGASMSRSGMAGMRREAIGLRDSILSNATIEGARRRLADLERAQVTAVDDALKAAPKGGAILPSDRKRLQDAVTGSTRELEKQRDLVKDMEERYSDLRANLESIRKTQEDITDKLQYPHGRLPAAISRDRELERRNLTNVQREQISGMFAPLITQEIADKARRAGLIIGPGGVTHAPVSTEAELKLDERSAHERELSLTRQLHLVTEITKQRDTDLREQIAFGEKAFDTAQKTAVMTEESAVQRRRTLSPDTIENRLSFERQIADIRIRAADDVLDHEEKNIISKYTDEQTRNIALTDARIKNANSVAEIEQQLALQTATEQKRQLDEVAGHAESLFHTLFTSPSKFGGALATTLRDAALKPIEQGLGQLVSRALYPTIFGTTGTGGIARSLRGLFGGSTRTSPIGTASDPVAVVVVGTGGGGGSGVGGGGRASLPWYTFPGPYRPPTFGGGIDTGVGAQSFGGGTGGSLPLGFMGLPVGMVADLASSVNLMNVGPTGTMLGGGSGGGTVSAGGGFNVGGIAGLISNFRKTNWFSLNRSSSGRITGLGGVGGAGIGAIGSLAFSSGISSQYSTPGSDIATIGGGAAQGFAAGGPIGAAVGAGIGAGIAGWRNRGTTRGTIEQILADPTGLFALGVHLFGGESDLVHTKKLVNQLYRISISDQTATSIIKLAKDRYGSAISIAVRSPEVREMLGLYAAGTGQSGSFPQSASVPHGGSLVESGGALYQQATSVYGNRYAYQSALPIYGGSAGTFPSPGGGGGGGGNTYLSLHVSGDSVGRFMDGSYVSPDAVASKYGSALASSAGRLSNAITLSEPGSIVS